MVTNRKVFIVKFVFFIMGEKLTIKEIIKELSVLIPLYGRISVDRRMRKGDVPLIFQSRDEKNGRTGLEILMDNEPGVDLLDGERQDFRRCEYNLKSFIFDAYHIFTSSYFLYCVLN